MTLYQIYKNNVVDGVAKYIKLANAIRLAIEKGFLQKSDRLPSIAEFKENLDLGKESILKAIDLLKEEGVVRAVHGKGFYIKNTRLKTPYRLFVLFDEFSEYKKLLYHAMLDGLKKRGELQLFFHHYNPTQFCNLMKDNLGQFTHYLVMPFPHKCILEALEAVPREKLFILDRNEVLPSEIPAVYQNYEQDVYEGFLGIKQRLRNYSKLVLVFPPHLNHPLSITKGFKQICRDLGLEYEIIDRVDSHNIKKGQAWFVIEDDDLVKVVEEAQVKNWQMGKDLGIVSYNDTAMKRIAAGGITTLSTNFELMGRIMVQMIMSGEKQQLRSIGKIIDRGSL
jgi:DNA-binding transcriptional regulator YhcF (GntR family)